MSTREVRITNAARMLHRWLADHGEVTIGFKRTLAAGFASQCDLGVSVTGGEDADPTVQAIIDAEKKL